VIVEKKVEEQLVGFQKWVDAIYELARLESEDIEAIYNAAAYQGFNREQVLRDLMVKVPEVNLVHEIILIGALRGPKKGAQIPLSNGKTIEKMGIPASGGKGAGSLTLNKIVAATADLAAYLLKRCNVPKRHSIDLPGWLQFPSAGSIRMPMNYRQAHRDFAAKFSKDIGGVFNETIYEQMVRNEYLDEKLKLF
jgi:hypothetical protein